MGEYRKNHNPSLPQQKDQDTSNLTKQLEVLKMQIKDLSSSSGLDGSSVVSLKNKVWELESSVAEQNEQLVEQANSIQRLDQVILIHLGMLIQLLSLHSI